MWCIEDGDFTDNGFLACEPAQISLHWVQHSVRAGIDDLVSRVAKRAALICLSCRLAWWRQRRDGERSKLDKHNAPQRRLVTIVTGRR